MNDATRPVGCKRPHAPTAARLLLISIVGMTLASCESEQTWRDPSPREVFETFLTHLYLDSSRTAFELLAENDQMRLKKPLAQLKVMGVQQDRLQAYSYLVSAGVENPFEIRRIEELDELSVPPRKGDQVKLRIEFHDGRSASAATIWDGSQWRVKL